jgi:hypothetical protein
MPYSESSLPFSGLTPLSRHTSSLGALDASERALTQTVAYLRILKIYGGRTDAEAAQLLHVERSSVNARRAPLVKAGLVVAFGTRKGPSGIKNVVWGLAP